MQYDAAKGERGLKDWAKGITVTAQKCGIDIFLFQTIQRVSTLQLLLKSQQLDLWQSHRDQLNKASSTIAPVAEHTVRPVMNRRMPHFRYNTVTKVLYSVDRKGNENVATRKTGLIDIRILSKIQRDHGDLEVIDLWGEIYLTTKTSDGGQLLRGHPKFDRYGEMFDWVAVTFDTTDGNGQMGPAKILAFFKDSAGIDCAVVHATLVSSGRETKAGNTMLVQNNRLEFTPTGQPALRTIRVNQIDRGLMAFEHENFKGALPSNINYAQDKSKYIVTCIENRSNWAHLFFEWAKLLPEVVVEALIPTSDEESDTDAELCSSESVPDTDSESE